MMLYNIIECYTTSLIHNHQPIQYTWLVVAAPGDMDPAWAAKPPRFPAAVWTTWTFAPSLQLRRLPGREWWYPKCWTESIGWSRSTNGYTVHTFLFRHVHIRMYEYRLQLVHGFSYIEFASAGTCTG